MPGHPIGKSIAASAHEFRGYSYCFMLFKRIYLWFDNWWLLTESCQGKQHKQC